MICEREIHAKTAAESEGNIGMATKVGVIGSGSVGKTLAAGFAKHGYDVMMGSREAGKLADWKGKKGSFAESAAFADVVVFAVKGASAEAAAALCGDGNLRIWQIGTHHEFEADESSFDRVIEWLEAGVKESAKQELACPDGSVNLCADFLVCPTEPFKKGVVQHAVFKSATNRRYVSGK